MLERAGASSGTGAPSVVQAGRPSRSRITATASTLESQSTGRRPSSSAAAPSVPLPAKKSRHQVAGRDEAARSAAARRAASGSGSPSSRVRSARRSCATTRRSAACPRAAFSAADEPGRHVRLAVDGLGVEAVRARVLDVDEDRVVLRRPAALRARAVVVGPDDLVQEAVAAEDLVEQHLAVVRLARVEVHVERAVLPQQPPRLAQPRLEEAEVVVVAVVVGRCADDCRAVAAPAEARAVAVGIGAGRERERAAAPCRC